MPSSFVWLFTSICYFKKNWCLSEGDVPLLLLLIFGTLMLSLVILFLGCTIFLYSWNVGHWFCFSVLLFPFFFIKWLASRIKVLSKVGQHFVCTFFSTKLSRRLDCSWQEASRFCCRRFWCCNLFIDIYLGRLYWTLIWHDELHNCCMMLSQNFGGLVFVPA